MSAENALILIVDDNKINLKVLGTILMQEGYEVAIAENGKDAIHEANTNTPNLILMDITMPVLDGFEATRQLKADKNTANIPVIFVTALNEESDETEGFKLGAVDYITKPVNRAIVLARVKTHLELNNRKLLLEKQVEKRTEELKLKNKELEETRLEIIRRLGKAAEFKDNETGNHILRMS
ncbi:MAG: response regulator, partial [Spirochaetaceae bacterium]|nr:response regulator [Spirochaetaceae bacterium]